MYLLKAQKETGATIHVAHVSRFTSECRYIKRLIDTGVYGKVVTANFHRVSPDPAWVVDHNNPAKTGGMAMDLHIHDVDFVRYIMGGDPDGLNSTVHKRADGTVDHVWAGYRYGDAILSTECSWDYPLSMPFNKGARVRFEKATVIYASNMRLTVYPEDGDAFNPELEVTETRNLGINVTNYGDFVRELNCFADAITDGKKKSPVPLSDAIGAMRLIRRELNEAKLQ